MEAQSPTGAFFDRPYSNAVIYQAALDGLIEAPRPAGASSYWRSVVTPALNPRVRERALAVLLLFDKAHMFAFDMCPPQALIDEGLLEFSHVDADKREVHELARELKWLVLAELRRRGTRVESDAFDEIVDTLASHSLYELYRDSVGHLIDDTARALANTLQIRYDKPPPTPQEQSLLKQSSVDAEKLLDKTNPVMSAAIEVGRLVQASRQLQLPVISTLSARAEADQHLTEAKAMGQDVFQAYQIYLSEVKVLPRLVSVRDVLRLRKDARVRDFRQAIFEWARALAEGNPDEEIRIRKEIRGANKGLEKIGRYRRISGWITWISLPVAVASFLTQQPLGLVLSPIGIGVKQIIAATERKYRWLLFGT